VNRFRLTYNVVETDVYDVKTDLIQVLDIRSELPVSLIREYAQNMVGHVIYNTFFLEMLEIKELVKIEQKFYLN
jgi:hypothetical protein